MRRLLIAGNWKMNASMTTSSALLSELVNADISTCDVAVFPPFPYLALAAESLRASSVRFGAQDCSDELSGAYTGEVSAAMLRDVGASMVLVGHSERRQRHHETDALVLKKAQQILAEDMTAVVCVGETLAQRQAGLAEKTVTEQLSLLLSQLSLVQWQRVVIAYEPVWAIGTGETASPEQAQSMHAHIRQLLGQVSVALAEQTRILYGGSVKSASAAELFAQPDIDGALVGGASLDAAEFLAICQS
ncbi:MAG: triose-phosphate isomerase [Bacterioplanes sp.]|nr:triose-phosphate isomerase [Bacterioplanes sp.]